MNRELSVWFAVGWAMVGGATSGGGIWWVTHQIEVNGRSILERAGWPLNTRLSHSSWLGRFLLGSPLDKSMVPV